MRYSRMEDRQPPKRSGSGGKGIIAIVVIVVLAAAVYLIGASKVGEFLSENVVDPIVGVFSPNDEGTPANDDKDKPSATKSINTIDFSIPEFSLYALQAGVFSDTENAQKYADELINKGGAGYVVEFDEGFRVLIAGYLNEDDAKNVKERLLEEQNMDTSIIEISGSAITSKVEADSTTADLLANAAINDDIKKMTEISLSKDKGEITEDQAIEQLTQLKEKSASMVEKMQSAGEDELAKALKEYYGAVDNAIEGALNSSEEVAFSSAIKSAYLASAVARQKLSEQLAA